MVRYVSPIRSVAAGVALAALLLVVGVPVARAGDVDDNVAYANMTGYMLVPYAEHNGPAPYLANYGGSYRTGLYDTNSYALPYRYGMGGAILARSWVWRDHKRYGDYYEHYWWKRGPKLWETPPYSSILPNNDDPDVAPVSLSWSGNNALNVRWSSRPEPVKSIDVDVTDHSNNMLSHQTVAEVPFHIQLNAPVGASFVRVTVKYADGSVASSALPL